MVAYNPDTTEMAAGDSGTQKRLWATQEDLVSKQTKHQDRVLATLAFTKPRVQCSAPLKPSWWQHTHNSSTWEAEAG